MSKHTPGPWAIHRVNNNDGDLNYCLIGEPRDIPKLRGGVAFAGTYTKRKSGAPLPHRIDAEQTLANARLIAAAPDLLATLRGLLSASERHIFGDGCIAERTAARAAIAKAEGR